MDLCFVDQPLLVIERQLLDAYDATPDERLRQARLSVNYARRYLAGFLEPTWFDPLNNPLNVLDGEIPVEDTWDEYGSFTEDDGDSDEPCSACMMESLVEAIVGEARGPAVAHNVRYEVFFQ